MIVATIIVFFLSLAGIVMLFGLKYREERAGVTLIPVLKELGDVHALDFKAFLVRCRAEASTWPPRAMMLARVLVRRGALSLAAFARMLERQSHRIADLVSHKHGFERTQTRSDFLRKVSEYRASSGVHSVVDIR